MTVRIEKPAINVREELADLRKPSGIAGEAMLRAETPQEQFNLIGAGRRNLIINGDMQVAQRGTSVTGIGSNAGGPFTCDRFQHAQGSTGGSGVTTMEQSTDGPDGFSSSLKLTVTTADTLSGGENLGIRYRIEGQNVQHLKFGSAAAESVTLSFWVKTSLTGTYGLELFSAGGTRDILKAYTVSTANTWEYKTLTFVGDTDTAIANDVNRGLELFFSLDAGPNDIVDPYTWGSTAAFRAPTGQVNFMATSGATWQITGVQLELGDTATPFEHRSFGDELARCQRYYQQIDSGLIGTGANSGGIVFSTDFPVEMRVKPSVSLTDTDFRVGDMVSVGHTLTSLTVSISAYATARNYAMLLGGTASPSIVNYRTYLHEPVGSNQAGFAFDAEL